MHLLQRRNVLVPEPRTQHFSGARLEAARICARGPLGLVLSRGWPRPGPRHRAARNLARPAAPPTASGFTPGSSQTRGDRALESAPTSLCCSESPGPCAQLRPAPRRAAPRSRPEPALGPGELPAAKSCGPA